MANENQVVFVEKARGGHALMAGKFNADVRAVGDECFSFIGSGSVNARECWLLGARLGNAAQRIGHMPWDEAFKLDAQERGHHKFCPWLIGECTGRAFEIVLEGDGDGEMQVVTLRVSRTRLTVKLDGYLDLEQMAALGHILQEVGAAAARSVFGMFDYQMTRDTLRGLRSGGEE